MSENRAINEVLLSPLSLGDCSWIGRIGLGPINPGFDAAATNLATVARFYSNFSKDDIRLLFLGGVAVNEQGRSNSRSLVLPGRETESLISAIVNQIDDSGGVLAVQIMHSGRQASSAETTWPLIAPSPLIGEYYNERPHAATKREIRSVVKAFRDAAHAADRAGAKIIEIHAAHGYLLSGFMSRATNQRTDEYGGSVRNRFRLFQEVVEAVRSVGVRSLGARVNVREKDPAGLTINELIDGLGPVSPTLDYVSVSAGMYSAEDDWIIPRRALGAALWREEARLLRHDLQVPIMIAGNIETADLAAEIVTAGDADVILMVRSLLADPMLLTKALRNETDTIQPCTELYLCKYHSRGATNVYCPHNPVLREPGLLPKVPRR